MRKKVILGIAVLGALALPTPPNSPLDNQPQTNPSDTLWYRFESGPDR